MSSKDAFDLKYIKEILKSLDICHYLTLKHQMVESKFFEKHQKYVITSLLLLVSFHYTYGHKVNDIDGFIVWWFKILT